MLEYRPLLIVRLSCNTRIGPKALTDQRVSFTISLRLVVAMHMPPSIHPLGYSWNLNAITDDFIAVVEESDASPGLRSR
jgi:hypothetical protein